MIILVAELNNWWLNNCMQKVYFHNKKSNNHNTNKKRLSEMQHIGKKEVVDINKLLNRVKIDKKNETKKKIIFYCSSILVLILLGTSVALLK